METIEIYSHCPECKSSIVDDIHNGERICSSCGVVVAEQMADYGHEAKTSNLEDKMKLARATGQTTLVQHDLGIATEIAIGTTDYSGKKINSQVANQMQNLRKWQQRVRVSSPRERRLSNVLSKITEMCQSDSLSKNVLETSSMIYRSLDAKKIDVKGKSVISISAAVVYMACKQCDVVRTLEEICRGVCLPKDVKSKSKLAARYYRNLVMELGSVTAPVIGMEKYITKIALDISSKIKDRSIEDGKAPNGIAAAYLYIASILLGQNVLQRDISSVSGVTEVTIRNRVKEILALNRMQISLRPILATK